MRQTVLTLVLPFFLLAGCDQINQQLGFEDPVKKEARIEAEGKAVGSACRQSGRAIEDCYAIYGWLAKADIYAGWREMDAYMRENQIETIVPQLPPPEPPGARKKKKANTETTAETPEKSSEKLAEKPGAKSAGKVAEKSGEEKAGEKGAEKGVDKSPEKSAEKSAEKGAEKSPAKN